MEESEPKKSESSQQETTPPSPAPQGIKTVHRPAVYLLFFILVGFGLAALIFSTFSKGTAEKKLSEVPKVASSELKIQSEELSTTTLTTSTQESSQSVMEEKTTAPSLSLSGILFSDRGSFALIDGRIVHEGGVIKGARLDKIFSDRVELTFQDQKIILRSR